MEEFLAEYQQTLRGARRDRRWLPKHRSPRQRNIKKKTLGVNALRSPYYNSRKPSGGMAERTNALVLKTRGGKTPVGSNPTASAHNVSARAQGPCNADLARISPSSYFSGSICCGSGLQAR